MVASSQITGAGGGRVQPQAAEEGVVITEDGNTLADVGEDGLIAALLARYPVPPGEILVGPGDDAAVLQPGGRIVASTDTLVQGFDFRLEWSSAHDVGVKVTAQNLADVAAMGGRPLALLVSLSAPPELAVRWARELADGLADECARAGASVVGGDLSEASELVVVGTALGVLDGEPVLRSGARPGHVIALAGRVGRSAAGLALLRAGITARDRGRAGPGVPPGLDPVLAGLIRWHLAPRPDYRAGRSAAAAGASAMIDTSDGLVRDAGRVAAASAVVLDLDPSALVPGPDLLAAAAAAEPGADPGDLALRWLLTGGEDHAMLACFPEHTPLPEPFRPIGRVRAAAAGDPASGDVLLGGRPWSGPTGWHHFS